MPSVTPVFKRVATSQSEISGAERDLLEEFIVTLYCATFHGQKVNDARRYLFTSKGKTMENIPPTAAAALSEHIKRSVLQARKWYHCLEATRADQDPAHWRWMKEDQIFFPVWSLMPPISKVTEALIRCGCKNCVDGRCKCRKSGLRCTELCGCQSKC